MLVLAVVSGLAVLTGTQSAVAGSGAPVGLVPFASIDAGDHSLGLAVTPVQITPMTSGGTAGALGYYAYATDATTHSVDVIDTADNTVVDTISVGSGQDPDDVSITPDGSYALITESGGTVADRVDIIDTATGVLVALPLSQGTGYRTGYGIGVSPVLITPHGATSAGYYFYVYQSNGSAQNEISVIDPVTATEVDHFSAGTDCAAGYTPHGLVVSADGADLFTSCTDTNPETYIDEFDTVTGAIAGGSFSRSFTGTGDTLAVHGSKLWIGSHASGSAGPQASVSILDIPTDTFVGTPTSIILGIADVDSIAFSPRPAGGDYAYVLDTGDDHIDMVSASVAESSGSLAPVVTQLDLTSESNPTTVAFVPTPYQPSFNGAVTTDPTNYYMYVSDSAGSGGEAFEYEAPYPTGFVDGTPGGATVGVAYSYTFTANAGALPTPDISIASGAVPAGLSAPGGGLPGGVLAGTPTTAGTSTFTLTASNLSGSTTSSSISIVTAPGSQAVSFTGPGTGVVGGTATLSATSPTDPANGGAGTGVVFTRDSSSGSGVCSVSGTTVTYTAAGTCVVDADEPSNSNYNAAVQVQQSITVSVAAVAPTTFTAASPPAAVTGTAYSYTFVANGSPVPTYTVASGSLPAGLTLSSSGVLSGTPTTAGSSAFTVTATNSAGNHTTSTVTLVTSAPVAPAPAPAPGSAPSAFGAAAPPASATVGTAYSYTFVADGTPAPTYTVGSGSLPAGMTLSAAGVLSGTPTTTGSFTFTVTATNSAGTLSSVAITVTVGSAPTPSPSPSPSPSPAPVPGQVPPAPRPVHVANGDGSATVTLGASTGGSAASTRYQASVNGGAWRLAPVVHRNPVAVLITGLTDGRTSTVRIRAQNAAGWSAPCTVRVTPRTWVTDPVSPRARRAEVPVPADPTAYRGPLRYTTALNRSHNGTIAVPLATVRGRPLHPGQAAVLSEDGLFAFNSGTLTRAGVRQLRNLVRSMHGDRAVTCEGYTDYGGLASHERTLARTRADAVCRALVADGAHVRVRAVGYGASRPVVIGAGPGQRAANRRVVIFITG